jgi:ubiquinone/menaquinone biosynthesis C-methylase UbiE
MKLVFARVLLVVLMIPAGVLPSAAQQTRLTNEQIASAEAEVPQLMELLELKPGMAMADVGAGFGAWTTQFSRALGPDGRVLSNEIGASQLQALRDSITKNGLRNVTVVAGTVNATNLPPACCDAILIRDAYHHFTQPADLLRSIVASLKPGGRLAVVDFPPRPNTPVPEGVPANRLGHGVPASVVEQELTAAGMRHVRTIADWSPKSQPASLYLALFRKP